MKKKSYMSTTRPVEWSENAFGSTTRVVEWSKKRLWGQYSSGRVTEK